MVPLHRWFGLLAGIWLFCAGFTGSMMVFNNELDRFLNPDLFAVSVGSYEDTNSLVSAAAAAHPGHYVSSIDLPSRSGEPAIAYLAREAGVAGTALWRVNIDPVTGFVLGSRDLNEPQFTRHGFMHAVNRFHYSLLLGGWVNTVFGIIALFWFFGHVIALYIAMNGGRIGWRDFRITKNSTLRQWHVATGLWMFPVTLVISLSAAYLNLGAEFRAAVSKLSPITPGYDQLLASVAAPDYWPHIDFDKAAELAAISAGGAVIDGISFLPNKALYRVRFFDERDINPLVGRRHIFVHTGSGQVVHDSHFAEGSGADRFLGWQFPLHSGKAFGWPGRLLVFLAGLAVCLSVYTGIRRWIHFMLVHGH